MVGDTTAMRGLCACSPSPHDGEVPDEAPSREQLAVPGLGKLPPTLLPESISKPSRLSNRTVSAVLILSPRSTD